MSNKNIINISEGQIEDALVANLTYLANLLKQPLDLKLINRQMRLKSGRERIDLLLSSQNYLCLIELKVVSFSKRWLKQIKSYRDELVNLQKIDKLIAGEIICYLLVTKASDKDVDLSKESNINIIVYEPIEVLKEFYKNLSTSIPFLKIKPNDYGVFSLGLINRALNQLKQGKTSQVEISKAIDLSKQSVHNHLKVAKEFGLVRERDKKFYFTDIGDQYVQYINENNDFKKLSKRQIGILKQVVGNDPFYSSTVFGIYSIVESAFILSRNSYPLKLIDLREMFSKVSGKVNEWNAYKSVSTATYTFLNFAIELELLGKVGQQVVLTPAGFRFILMLQLHKSIEMVESIDMIESLGKDE